MVKPIGERVLVKIEEKKETAGGLILPDGGDKKLTQKGEVLALGVLEDEKEFEIAVGDTIYFKRFAVDQVQEAEEFFTIDYKDVLAKEV